MLRACVDVLADARDAMLGRPGDAVAVDDVLGEIPRVAHPQVLVERQRVANVSRQREQAVAARRLAAVERPPTQSGGPPAWAGGGSIEIPAKEKNRPS